MQLGHQQARQVDLAAADVAVQVDTAGHHDATAGVDVLAGIARIRGDDAAIAHDDVAHLPIDTVGGVEYLAAVNAHHAPGPRRRVMPSSTCATLHKPSSRTANTGTTTGPSVRNR